MKSIPMTFTAKKIVQMIENNEMTFDNPMQRGKVWDAKRKSKLIDSILRGYPIPALYMEKSNSVFDVLDGKQRCTTINSYINNGFKLKDEESIIFKGKKYDISKKKYNELPSELQDLIRDYDLSIVYLEDATQEEKREIFIRLNSGKPMNGVELTKAEMKSPKELGEIASHKVILEVIDEDGVNKSTNFGFAMQTYVVICNENKCLLMTAIKPKLKSMSIDKSDVSKILKILDYYEEVFKILNQENDKDLLKKIKRKTHFISILPIMQMASDNSIKPSEVSEWIKMFFRVSEGTTTIDPEYDAVIKGGTNTEKSVNARINSVKNSFEKFLNGEKNQEDIELQTTLS